MPYIKRDGIPTCKQSGVYCITNKTNGKVYVGSATSLRGRLSAHRSYLRRGKHDNPILQRAWFKDGELSFKFDVLEECDPDLLIEKEQHWIDSLKSHDRRYGYNICPAAGSAMKGRSHSAESREKMSATRKGKAPVKATEAAAKANRGRRRPTSVRVAIALANLGKRKDLETIERMKANHWTKSLPKSEVTSRMRATGQAGLVAQGKNVTRVAGNGDEAALTTLPV